MSDPLPASEIQRAFETGRSAWPAIQLDKAVFAQRLAALEVTLGDLRERSGDLFVAIACGNGAAQAVAEFHRQHASIIEGALRRMRLDSTATAEVMQRILIRLFSGERPRILTYSGRGPLLAWVRVLAVRTALDSLGEARDEVSYSTAGLPLSLVAASHSPELSAMRTEHRAALAAALEAALSALPPREKTILRLHVVDGLSLAGVAAVYRVNRSTALRWVAAIRKGIVAQLRRSLGNELRLSGSDIRSLTTLYSGELSLSLSRVLASQPIANEGAA